MSELIDVKERSVAEDLRREEEAIYTSAKELV